jgi:hypothetical protein
MCRYRRELARDFSYPAATNHNIILIKDNGLSRCDCALRRVKGDQSLAVSCRLNSRGRRLMAMANFGMNPDWLAQVIKSDPVHAVGQ